MTNTPKQQRKVSVGDVFLLRGLKHTVTRVFDDGFEYKPEGKNMIYTHVYNPYHDSVSSFNWVALKRIKPCDLCKNV